VNLLVLLSAVAVFDSTAQSTVALTTIHLEKVGEDFHNPVYVTSPPGDSRLFVVEQAGRIRVMKNGHTLPVPFLDIASSVSSGGERGMLSMAFHPEYRTNGWFFVNYTDRNGLGEETAGTIKCINHKYQVVHVIPEDRSSGDCTTTRHENSHIKDFKQRYGEASCAADAVQGSTPSFPDIDPFTGRTELTRDASGVSEADRFITLSEANAYAGDIDCLKKKKNACTNKSQKKDLDRKIKFAMKKFSENFRELQTNGYPASQGLGGAGSR